MNTRIASLALLAASVVASFAATAATNSVDPWSGAKPRFVTLPNNFPGHVAPIHPPANVTQWNGSFVDHGGHTITYTMIGTNPATNNAPSTIPVVLIPIRMVYGASNGNMTFDPNTKILPNGKSVTNNTLDSPIFKTMLDVGGEYAVRVRGEDHVWNSSRAVPISATPNMSTPISAAISGPRSPPTATITSCWAAPPCSPSSRSTSACCRAA